MDIFCNQKNLKRKNLYDAQKKYKSWNKQKVNFPPFFLFTISFFSIFRLFTHFFIPYICFFFCVPPPPSGNLSFTPGSTFIIFWFWAEYLKCTQQIRFKTASFLCCRAKKIVSCTESLKNHHVFCFSHPLWTFFFWN